jgi:hypothetical protein
MYVNSFTDTRGTYPLVLAIEYFIALFFWRLLIMTFNHLIYKCGLGFILNL